MNTILLIIVIVESMILGGTIIHEVNRRKNLTPPETDPTPPDGEKLEKLIQTYKDVKNATKPTNVVDLLSEFEKLNRPNKRNTPKISPRRN